MKALVVDDSKMIRRIAKKALVQLGFAQDDVLEADDGNDALETALRNLDTLDVVLLDCNLPGLDGLSVLKKLVAVRVESKPSVVVVTSNSSDGDRNCAMDGGADMYLTKPFTPQMLAESLRGLLGR